MSNGTADYDFTPTQDWFSHNIPHWTALFPHIHTKSFHERRNGARILEIGSWEGRSAVFLATELCSPSDGIDSVSGDKDPKTTEDANKIGGEVVCIDHFDLFQTEAGKDRFNRITHNLSLTGKSYRIIPEFSVTGLMKLLNEAIIAESGSSPAEVGEQGFDWVYIDGSHRSDDTFLDGELAWRLTRKGGIMIFDDYLWNVEPETSIEHPKRGIDGFLALHQGEYERFSGKGEGGETKEYQVVLRKTVEMRIGYLLPSDYTLSSSLSTTTSGVFDSNSFGYGINIGVVCDSVYAMPTSVLLSTLIEHSPGRKISIYLLDCGLSDVDKVRIEQSVSSSSTVTLNFLPLPPDSLTTQLGSAVWGKIDLIKVAPVERLLYLDGDILVRGDVRPLWDINLEDNPIGAALDVGHPMGHDTTTKANGGKYFNAGVLLLDLTNLRSEFTELVAKCCELKSSKYADQDALNVLFAGRWKEFSLKWNAQGLGTYAKWEAPGRHWIDRQSMSSPAIVHFTGPVHPSLADVLNPYVQPFTAKPWGYAGSPGHPYAKEWLVAVGKTSWGAIFEGEWKAVCEEEKKRAAENAFKEFRSTVDEARKSYN